MIAHCHHCEFMGEPDGQGGAACLISTRDILEHDKDGKCPTGYFDRPPLKRRHLRAERIRQMLDEAEKLFPEYPADQFSGRGLVACCDQSTFEAAYTTIRQARDAGNNEPVELWYLPPLWPWMREAVAELANVSTVDVTQAAKNHLALVRDLETLYAYAAAYCRFSEVAMVGFPQFTFHDKRAIWKELLTMLWKCEHGHKQEITNLEVEPHPRLKEIRGKYIVGARLESNGDILVMLPALRYLHDQGKDVTFVCYRQYVPMLEGLSWLTVISVDPPMSQPAALEKFRHAGTVFDLHCDQADLPREQRKQRWSMAAWAQTGVDCSLYDLLPLNFDNRDDSVEQAIVRRHRHSSDKPLLLICFAGHSSPFQYGDLLRCDLLKWFADTLEIVDLSMVRCRRITDLLGLYDHAFAGVFIDSGTLHLAYAVELPTVALVRDNEGPNSWGASEPRRHHILRLGYSELSDKPGRVRVRKAIEELLCNQ